MSIENRSTGVVRFTSGLPPAEPYLPAADRILAGHPEQRAWVLYQSEDEKYLCGVWECAPGKWRVVFDEHEFCQLLAGEIIIVSDAGETTQLGPGDAFVTPKGFTGTWEVRVAARKTFALYL